MDQAERELELEPELEERLLLEPELEEPQLNRLLEELLELFITLLIGAIPSTNLVVRREEELEEELGLLERELLELEETAVLFFRPGTRIFLSFIRTFLSSRISSSSLMLITLRIFSAALSPT